MRQNSLDDILLEVLCFSPGNNAANAESMIAVGEDAITPFLSSGLLGYLVHADATSYIFALVKGP